MVNDDEYQVVVRFTRSLAEDAEMALQKYPTLPLAEALRQQLREELQQACDAGMAGQFQIEQIPLTQKQKNY